MSDPAQHWSLPVDGGLGGLIDGKNGMCVGCASQPSDDPHRNVSATSCGNDAEATVARGGGPTTGHKGLGLGMQVSRGDLVACAFDGDRFLRLY